MRPHPRIPQYRCYKPKNLGLVVIEGRQHYLGKFGTPESLAEYHRLVQEWLANPAAAPAAGPTPARPTIHELVVAFWKHAETHYRAPDGTQTGELENVRHAIRPLRRLYRPTRACEFGPNGLRAVREQMIREGLSRGTINARIGRIRRLFKWAASVELIPVAVVQALQTVQGLQQGRSAAREGAGVKPVPIADVEATLPSMPRQVAAMVRIQLLTGCRPEDVQRMKGRELTPGEPNWEFRPSDHKNAWRGQRRVIPLGPRVQEIIKGFLRPDPEEFLFSPRDVVETLHARRGDARVTTRTPSESGRRVREKPGRKHRTFYDRRAYRQAIVRACDKAFPHPREAELRAEAARTDLGKEHRHKARADLEQWRREHRAELATWRREHRWTPLQLRHTRATEIRAMFGLEAAQAVLGHARADVTQIYAERDLAKAHEVMAAIG